MFISTIEDVMYIKSEEKANVFMWYLQQKYNKKLIKYAQKISFMK